MFLLCSQTDNIGEDELTSPEPHGIDKRGDSRGMTFLKDSSPQVNGNIIKNFVNQLKTEEHSTRIFP